MNGDRRRDAGWMTSVSVVSGYGTSRTRSSTSSSFTGDRWMASYNVKNLENFQFSGDFFNRANVGVDFVNRKQIWLSAIY